MSSYRTDFVFVLAAICVVHSAAFADQDGPGLPPPPADRIAYYSQQVAKHSRHYPAYALLGAAWLDQARLTYDPRDLAQARAAFQRSLEIQPNFEALKGMAAACNYSHRFAEALQWCRQAADAFPQDTSLLAMQVEAHLALGQVDQARRCVGGLPDQPRDYYTAVAQAMVHAALGEDTRAVAAYLAAARLAHDQNAAPLAVWAHVAAAGLFLDSGNLQAARPHLEAAQRAGVPPAEPNRPGRAADQPQTAKPAHWDPSAAFLGLHQAELAEAEGRLHQALSLYESLLERRADPELFRRAYLLSTRLHETHRAPALRRGRAAVPLADRARRALQPRIPRQPLLRRPDLSRPGPSPRGNQPQVQTRHLGPKNLGSRPHASSPIHRESAPAVRGRRKRRLSRRPILGSHEPLARPVPNNPSTCISTTTTTMSNRQIVITGVGRGLGRAMTEKFIELGHTVLGCSRQKARVEALRKRFGPPHRFDAVDVADAASVGKWAKALLADAGPPDLLLNNAAIINANARLWEVPPDEFSRVIDVNIKGVFYVLRHFLSPMVKRRKGVIVNFSSGWGRSTSPEVAPYCATKFAIEGLTQALAQELPQGMCAVPLNPGVVNTDMLRSCFGQEARSYPSPDEWARKAVPLLLALGPKDNGRPLTVR